MEVTHSYIKTFKSSVGSYCNCYLTFQFCILSFPFYHISFPIFKFWQWCLGYFFYCPVRSLTVSWLWWEADTNWEGWGDRKEGGRWCLLWIGWTFLEGEGWFCVSFGRCCSPWWYVSVGRGWIEELFRFDTCEGWLFIARWMILISFSYIIIQRTNLNLAYLKSAERSSKNGMAKYYWLRWIVHFDKSYANWLCLYDVFTLEDKEYWDSNIKSKEVIVSLESLSWHGWINWFLFPEPTNVQTSSCYMFFHVFLGMWFILFAVIFKIR